MTFGSKRMLTPLSMFLAAAGCSAAGDGHHHGSGSAEVIARTSSALQTDISRVGLTVSGPGISPDIVKDLAKVGASWQGIIGGIPSGTGRMFDSAAYDHVNTVLYSGHAGPVTIQDNQQALVAVLLQQEVKPDPFHNTAPTIDAVVASSSTVEPGESISIQASASDPDPGDTLTYAWSGGGTFSDPTSLSTSWTAPGSAGDVTLTLRVTDQKGASAAVSFTVHVQPIVSTGGGSASISANFNDAPHVDGVTIDRSPLDVNQTAHLSATASDLESDALSYEWSTNCTGSFDSTTSTTPSFTLSALPTGGSCAFTVKVTDARGGWNTGSVSVSTGPAVTVAARTPIVVDSSFQAADTVDAGTNVLLAVKGHDPDGGDITYSWSSPTGSVGAATTNANGENQVVWTPPACFDADAHISVTLTSTTGNSVTKTFTVTPGAYQGDCVGELIDVNVDQSPSGTATDFSMSSDGRYFAFTAQMPYPLYPAAANSRQVYLRDRLAGTTSLLSVSFYGVVEEGGVSTPAISSDGRYALFFSTAPNLIGLPVPPPQPSAPMPQYYRWDRDAGVKLNVLFDLPFGPSGPFEFKMAANSHYACLVSSARLTSDDDSNGTLDAYRLDLETQQFALVSNGVDSNVFDCAISGDGQRIAFFAESGSIHVRDMSVSGTTSVSWTVPWTGNLAMSADGSTVAFATDANLTAEDEDDKSDIYLWTGSESQLRRVDRGPALGGAYNPMLSADGGVVAFVGYDGSGPSYRAYARKLSDSATVVQTSLSQVSRLALTSDGEHLAYMAGSDIYYQQRRR